MKHKSEWLYSVCRPTSRVLVLLVLTLAAQACNNSKSTTPLLENKPAAREPEFPRVFTKGVTNAGDWSQIEPLFDKLEAQLKEIKTPEELKAWLLRRSELDSVSREENTRRRIAYSGQTDNGGFEQASLDYTEKISPKYSERADRLDRLYLACPVRLQTDHPYLALYDRKLENKVNLFRKENIPLDTESSKMVMHYQKISSAMTVRISDREMTIPQARTGLTITSRALREKVWRAIEARYQEDRDKLNALFDTQLQLRAQMARHAGFDNYRDYIHQAKDRFDYTPQDCLKFDEAVAREVVPMLAKQRRAYRSQLGLGELRPWDMAVELPGALSERPYRNAAEMENQCEKIFNSLSPTFGEEFKTMRRLNLLDVGSRKGKTPGSTTFNLAEIRLPFVSLGTTNMTSLFHESGHAFHHFAYRWEPLVYYRSTPIEFSEFASLSMELLAFSKLDLVYTNPRDVQRKKREHLGNLFEYMCLESKLDAFQQWIYTHPAHTDAERDLKWQELDKNYSPEEDWSGLEQEHGASWQRIKHLFHYPFYAIEYNIARLGALQLWLQYRENPAKALANYQKALALGGTRPLPELFAAAEVKFDLSPQTLHKLMAAVDQELERLK